MSLIDYKADGNASFLIIDEEIIKLVNEYFEEPDNG